MANFFYVYPDYSGAGTPTPIYFVLNGSNQAVTEDDTNPANNHPLPVKMFPLQILETRFHDTSSVNINGNGGAWVELGGAAPLTNTILELGISFNIGEPTEIGVGPNAGAVTRIAIANQGEGPTKLGVQLVSGDQLWIRSLSANSVTSGYLTVNLSG